MEMMRVDSMVVQWVASMVALKVVMMVVMMDFYKER